MTGHTCCARDRKMTCLQNFEGKRCPVRRGKKERKKERTKERKKEIG